jgi:hypothetical protein
MKLRASRMLMARPVVSLELPPPDRWRLPAA